MSGQDRDEAPEEVSFRERKKTRRARRALRVPVDEVPRRSANDGPVAEDGETAAAQEAAAMEVEATEPAEQTSPGSVPPPPPVPEEMTPLSDDNGETTPSSPPRASGEASPSQRPPTPSSRPPAPSSRPPAPSSRPPAPSSRPPAPSSRPPPANAPAASESHPPASASATDAARASSYPPPAGEGVIMSGTVRVSSPAPARNPPAVPEQAPADDDDEPEISVEEASLDDFDIDVDHEGEEALMGEPTVPGSSPAPAASAEEVASADVGPAAAEEPAEPEVEQEPPESAPPDAEPAEAEAAEPEAEEAPAPGEPSEAEAPAGPDHVGAELVEVEETFEPDEERLEAEPMAEPTEPEAPSEDDEDDAEHLELEEVEPEEALESVPAPPPVPEDAQSATEGAKRPDAPPEARAAAEAEADGQETPEHQPEPTPAPPRKRKRKPWYEEFFNDDYLRTVPEPPQSQIVKQCDFIERTLGLEKGATILDVGCGLGLHAVELASRGYLVVGLDLSLPMLSRAADEAQDRGLKINFLHADMREMSFEGAFDAVLCWGTTLGYFDDETNRDVVERLYRALKPMGLLLLDVVNRDHVVPSQPNLVWFEGDGCVCMEETQLNFITSRLQVKRTVILDDGRQRESHYSLRLYSLHELGGILHQQGFRVAQVSGMEATPGVFLGQTSPRMIILAERRLQPGDAETPSGGPEPRHQPPSEVRGGVDADRSTGEPQGDEDDDVEPLEPEALEAADEGDLEDEPEASSGDGDANGESGDDGGDRD